MMMRNRVLSWLAFAACAALAVPALNVSDAFASIRTGARASASGVESEGRVQRVRRGVWGGRGAALTVGEKGASIEFDCARGRIEGALKLDRSKRFEARGTFVAEGGGPVSREGIVEHDESGSPARETGQSAIYRGRLSGGTLTLTVTLTETGRRVGTYRLAHGREADITKCL